jgi:hypothetical protein
VDFGVEHGVLVGTKALPVLDGGIPVGPRRGVVAARRYAKVVSSGAMRPALAPHSMLMFEMVMRPSMETPR